MKQIVIDFIPQSEQRFNDVGQVGDYYETPNTIHFKITQFKRPVYSMACALHELVEKFRNDQLGIKDADVDQWDIDNADHPDPGLIKEAPYHKTHMEADAIERSFVVMAGGDWAEYEEQIDEVFEHE